MRAAWYEQQGPARDVLVVGELPPVKPAHGEVLVRVHASGVNPGDVKKRAGWLGSAMPFPRVVPHSDGAGVIDAVGEGVSAARVGERVWCHGAQSYRPLGTAAELVAIPDQQALTLPDDVSFEHGACLGIPGITAHRAVFGDGPVRGSTVLIAGVLGAVGALAAELAAWGGASVLGTVRSAKDRRRAQSNGVEHVFALDDEHVADAIRSVAPNGVKRIVEVALSDNARLDTAVIAQGGVIAAYGSADPEPRLPFWPLLFENVTIRLLGSDDFPGWAKRQAATDMVSALRAGRLRPEIAESFQLEDIAAAHEAVEHPTARGRVLVKLGG